MSETDAIDAAERAANQACNTFTTIPRHVVEAAITAYLAALPKWPDTGYYETIAWRLRYDETVCLEDLGPHAARAIEILCAETAALHQWKDRAHQMDNEKTARLIDAIARAEAAEAALAASSTAQTGNKVGTT